MENSNIPVPEKRIAEFERLGYGMFIHWGLYALSGAGEKTMLFHKIPKEEYRTDNSETLSWKCCGDALQLDCTSYSYGQNLVVRVACIELN